MEFLTVQRGDGAKSDTQSSGQCECCSLSKGANWEWIIFGRPGSAKLADKQEECGGAKLNLYATVGERERRGHGAVFIFRDSLLDSASQKAAARTQRLVATNCSLRAPTRS